ncbi:MAG: hypothetical protein FD167_2106 [bacterium]|nr:MAG: hypothetical protein FD167_2106 [bacterium]
MNHISDEQEAITLAYRIALTFNDTDNNQIYLAFCKKYPLEIVREVFVYVRDLPDEKIRKSRSALFFYLCKQRNGEQA